MKTRFIILCGAALLWAAPQQEASAQRYWIKVSGNPDGSINCSPNNCHPLYHTCCSEGNQDE